MLEEVGEQMAHCLPVCAFDRVACGDDVQITNVWVLFVGVRFHFVVQLKVKKILNIDLNSNTLFLVVN